MRGRGFQEHDIDSLGEIVAELVEGIDGVLDLDHGAIGDERGAGLIFTVPKIEVRTVLVKNEGFQRIAGGKKRSVGVVPVGGGLIVELGDEGGVQHEGAK